MKTNILTASISIISILFYEPVYGGDDITLCTSNEDIYFSCPFKNGKIISVCASGNTSPNTGYVQYRYGKPDKLELIHPKKKIPPENIIYYVDATEGSAIRDILKFKIGEFTYIIHQSFFSGLTVLKNDEIVFKKTCEAGGNAVISRKVNSGINEIHKSEEDFR
nr:hypothetical protein [uncultured Pseudomonas sp.]